MSSSGLTEKQIAEIAERLEGSSGSASNEAEMQGFVVDDSDLCDDLATAGYQLCVECEYWFQRGDLSDDLVCDQCVEEAASDE